MPKQQLGGSSSRILLLHPVNISGLHELNFNRLQGALQTRTGRISAKGSRMPPIGVMHVHCSMGSRLFLDLESAKWLPCSLCLVNYLPTGLSRWVDGSNTTWSCTLRTRLLCLQCLGLSLSFQLAVNLIWSLALQNCRQQLMPCTVAHLLALMAYQQNS